MSELKEEKLDFWIKHNYNVLFSGKHGTGKTSCIISAFNRAGLKWKYFSASTLDPWVDLVGVPKEVQSEHGNYLDLVRPKEFQYDEIEAIFFDEYNRSHKKVRNAVMELIQFKSINGKKFNNLKLIWAAVNPSDEEGEYDVEKIDPAQEDRFHIKVSVPYKPSEKYFSNVYGNKTAHAACSWWNELPDVEKNKISPRRLDYAMNLYTKNGDLRDVLPESSNIPKLTSALKFGPVSDMLSSLMSKNRGDEAREFLKNENNYNSSLDWILKTKERRNFFIPVLENEKISVLMKKETVFNTVLEEAKENKRLLSVLENIVLAGLNKELVKKIYKKAKYDPILGQLFGAGDPLLQIDHITFGTKPIKMTLNANSTEQALSDFLNNNLGKKYNTYDRVKSLKQLVALVPDKEIDSAIATKLFGYLINFARSSQIGTILRSKNEFMGLFNYVIELCCKKDSINWNDFQKNYLAKGNVSRVWNKLKYNRQIAESVLCIK
jgi:hypothetical protein